MLLSELGRIYKEQLFKFFGPSVIHFQHEITLLPSLFLLTLASYKSFYKDSFGNSYDYYTLLLTTFWLGKYLLIRILCVNDYGLVSKALTRIYFAGQYCDYVNITCYEKSSSSITSTSNNSSSAQFPSCYSNSGWLDIFFSTKKYIESNVGYLLCQMVSYVTSSTVESSNGNIISNNTNKRGSTSAKSTSTTRHLLNHNGPYYKLIEQYSPPLQLCIAVVVMLFFCITIFVLPPIKARGDSSVSSYLSSSPLWRISSPSSFMSRDVPSFHGGFSSPGGAASPGLENGFVGTTSPGLENGFIGVSSSSSSFSSSGSFYVPHYGNSILGIKSLLGGSLNLDEETPSLLKYFFWMSIVGTVTSLIFYARLMLPIPDLMTCDNLWKAASVSAIATVNLSFPFGFCSKHKVKKDVAWAEQIISIQHQPRLHLYTFTILLRIIEALWLCVILPQSAFTCKVTHHCESGLSFYNQRNSSVYYQSIVWDSFTTLIIFVSVLFLSFHCLVGQMILLHRNYLSPIGYLTCETVSNFKQNPSSIDDYVNDTAVETTYTNFSPNRNHTPSSSSRRYYRRSPTTPANSTNNPPSSNITPSHYDTTDVPSYKNSFTNNIFSSLLFNIHMLFSYELSHPSTSFILNIMAYAQFVIFVLFLLLYLFLSFFHTYDLTALQLVLLAHGIPTWRCLVKIGVTDSAELNGIATDINNHVQKISSF